MARKGNAWVEVMWRGEVVGFVTGPDRDGLYAAFLDREKGGSTIVGTYFAESAAKDAVVAAHQRS
jgi:hypothetical protein